jgi:hypothetical protein
MAAQRKSSEYAEAAALLEEEETPAGIAGSEFFGGNKQKEELFDPIAEAEATIIATDSRVDDPFEDAAAFDSTGKKVAESLQKQVNEILYGEETSNAYTYATNVQWESPFGKGSGSPLRQLQQALEFYRRVDVALISCHQTRSNSLTLRWEISVLWPIFWEARVVLTGTSLLELNDSNQIVKQVDVPDASDVFATIVSQVLPRFWDTYHIGMTPSAECMPKILVRNTFPWSRYRVYDIMPRLVYKPSRLDTSRREDAYAEVIPNHAFATVIKTMGPKRQRYIPTTPLEIVVQRNPARITWHIPIAVELLAGVDLALPGDDPETLYEAMPEVDYEFQSKRRVATVAYGGSPQDEEVVELRKTLYQQVVKDGFQPKLVDGMPQFFFLQNDAKACYTNEGLGMGVYDWRPKFVKANEVGIELELK